MIQKTERVAFDAHRPVVEQVALLASAGGLTAPYPSMPMAALAGNRAAALSWPTGQPGSRRALAHRP